MPSSRRQAKLSTIGEFQLIRSITPAGSIKTPGVILGIGDDGAIVQIPAGHHCVVSTDLLVEHIHFNRNTMSFFDIGYKAAAANLSDMAAMGAQPKALLVSLALPPTLTFKDWKELYRGLSASCRTLNIPIIGGDTSSSLTDSFLTVTVLGIVKKGCELRRSGAHPGDWLYVSGTLGDSSAGLDYLLRNKSHSLPRKLIPSPLRFLVKRHCRPTPRVSLGMLLGARHWATAAIDVSDGLSSDLGHLCQQSRVGALVSSADLPRSPSLRAYATQKNAPPLSWVLHGGEDYELLFTVPPRNVKRVETAARHLKVPITKIGIMTEYTSGVHLEEADGSHSPLKPGGFDHFHS